MQHMRHWPWLVMLSTICQTTCMALIIVHRNHYTMDVITSFYVTCTMWYGSPCVPQVAPAGSAMSTDLAISMATVPVRRWTMFCTPPLSTLQCAFQALVRCVYGNVRFFPLV